MESKSEFLRRRSSKSTHREFKMFQAIHSQKKVSRIELAKQTGASLSSLTAITARLMNKGLIVESGLVSTIHGRKPILLSARDDIAYYVGVDLGTYFLRVVVTDNNGNVLHRIQTESELHRGREAVLKKIFKLINQAIEKSQDSARVIRGIGIAFSGVIDSRRGLVLSLPRPGQALEWKNVPLQAAVEEKFGIPCVLQDSVRAIAIAEKVYGVASGLQEFIYVDVGMGIGSAIFVHGELYGGGGGSAGELGHVTVDERGPLCCCGSNGCLEAMASGGAVIQAIRNAIEKGVDSRVRTLSGGNLERVTIESIGQAAVDNDSLAFRILNDAFSHIGVVLADIVNLLNPSVIILGGAVVRAVPELLLDTLRRVLKQRAMEKSAHEVELKTSALGGEGGAIGAARIVSEKVLESLYHGG